MLELVRGYATAVFDEVEPTDGLAGLSAELRSLSGVLVSSEMLRQALTDSQIPATERADVLRELLETKAGGPFVALVTFPVENERAAELPKTYGTLLELAEARVERSAAGQPPEPEPPIGRSGALERIRGYAERVFERIGEPAQVGVLEDELFRIARILEGSRDLRSALADQQVPLHVRLSLLAELLEHRARPETAVLVGYTIRAGRARDVAGAVEYLASLAVAERGRRVGHVRAAVELDDDERARLAEALSRRTRRTVELRVTIDPSVIGGIDVGVGDTVIDGTVRHRLEQLRDTILQLR